MVDASRFEGLKKLPEKPAAQVLREVEVELKTPLKCPETASISEVLTELAGEPDKIVPAEIDMMRLLAQAMPRREAVWWSCLAARDIVGHTKKDVPKCLETAEAWVFRPGDDTRRAAFEAMKVAKPFDDTSLCAMVAVYASGSFGPDELEEAVVPPGVFGNIVLGMLLTSLGAAPADEFDRGQVLIDRGLDIARGGNGRVDKASQAGAPEAGGGGGGAADADGAASPASPGAVAHG